MRKSCGQSVHNSSTTAVFSVGFFTALSRGTNMAGHKPQFIHQSIRQLCAGLSTAYFVVFTGVEIGLSTLSTASIYNYFLLNKKITTNTRGGCA
jgi:hypothetical protein